jgi:hypothetical protein
LEQARSDSSHSLHCHAFTFRSQDRSGRLIDGARTASVVHDAGII